MPEPESSPRGAQLVTILATLVALTLTIYSRLAHLTTYGLWMDEVYSIRIARLSWSGLFDYAAADAVHPPLFYVLLKFWVLVGGESLVWLKIFPLLFAFAAIALVYPLGKELRLRAAEFAVTLLFVSLNTYLVYYAQEVRMYSMLMFLSVLSIWSFLRFVSDKGWRPGFVFFVVNLAMVYTHYFGWLTVGAEGLALVILYRDKWKAFFLHGIGLIVFYLPWVIYVVMTISARGNITGNPAWIDRPPVLAISVLLADLEGHFNGIRSTIAAGMLIVITPLVICLWQNRKDLETRRIAILLGSLAFLPILAAFVLSQITANSVWVDRYLIASAIPFLLLLAVSANRVRPRALSVTFMVLMIVWSLGAGFWNLSLQHRVNWSRLAETFNTTPEQPAYVLEEWAAMPLTEMRQRQHPESDAAHVVARVDDIRDSAFWFLYRTSTWKEQQTPEQRFQTRGCAIASSMIDRADSEEVHLLNVQCAPG